MILYRFRCLIKLSPISFLCEKFSFLRGRVCAIQVGFFKKFMVFESIDFDAIVFKELLAQLLPTSQAIA